MSKAKIAPLVVTCCDKCPRAMRCYVNDDNYLELDWFEEIHPDCPLPDAPESEGDAP